MSKHGFCAGTRPARAQPLKCLLLIAALAAASPVPAQVVDDLRVRQLESEVNRLQRELDEQSRRIDELERGARTGALTPRGPATPPAEREDRSPAWLLSTNWDRVKPGMKELDVIALLGRPTSVRADADGKRRSLMYAMELGPNAILAGSVSLGDTGVAEIHKPVLR
jgi:predicted RNase H-like nuclease (RuvC/YqgF family)